MKKWNFIVLLFVFSFSLVANTSHQHSIQVDKKITPQMFSIVESEYVHPDAIKSEYLEVVPMSITGFSGKNLDKLNKAFEVLEEVVNSEEFKERVINFKNRKGERAFASNKGMTNEEIYEHFMEGREVLRPNTPGEMNFDLRLYNRWWSRVIGYTSPTTNLINVNYKYFKNFGPHEVASNLAHEWVHKMGFDHTSAAEHDSAPYAIGYIVEELGAKLLTSPIQKVSLQ